MKASVWWRLAQVHFRLLQALARSFHEMEGALQGSLQKYRLCRDAAGELLTHRLPSLCQTPLDFFLKGKLQMGGVEEAIGLGIDDYTVHVHTLRQLSLPANVADSFVLNTAQNLERATMLQNAAKVTRFRLPAAAIKDLPHYAPRGYRSSQPWRPRSLSCICLL